jgi:3-isopropylmalate/(R)-2-methylmalate dehydratase small subunit
MKPFTKHTGIVAPIIQDNVDTDQIIPSREMKRVSKHGLGEGLFAGWRYQYDDMEKIGLIDEFVLNQPAYKSASIILGGKNWGCGSSREHAVWALLDYGIRVVIAESFGRIFYRNCARNGLLAIELPPRQIELLATQTSEDPQSDQLTIDLEKNSIDSPRGDTFEFHMPASDRNMLINGLDYIEYTLQHEDKISKFIQNDKIARPWAYL